MFSISAHAKINWSLDILGTRPDGYHIMDMLMQCISLHDTLTFVSSDQIFLYSANTDASDDITYDENNLVYRAAQLLKSKTNINKGVTIYLNKRIPSGAGLGGGSADAAGTLIGLNTFWNLNLPMETLAKYALELGADVPFLLGGGLARVNGIGEIITPLSPPPSFPLVLIQPCSALSTAEIFHSFDSFPSSDIIHPKTNKLEQALLSKDINSLCENMYNVLQPISLLKRPEMQSAIDSLYHFGSKGAMMSGSGSVVYGVFENENLAKIAFEQLSKIYDKCYLASSVTHGVIL